jgi:AraC-like DNA-binding protein
MKIAAIAHAVGYPDPFHFSRVFSRLQGRSPESYRASCKHPFDS